MWRERYEQAVARGRLTGFDAAFHDLWRYYLMYCEGGFRGGGIDVAQVTLALVVTLLWAAAWFLAINAATLFAFWRDKRLAATAAGEFASVNLARPGAARRLTRCFLCPPPLSPQDVEGAVRQPIDHRLPVAATAAIVFAFI